MKFRRIIKIVRNVLDVIHSRQSSVHDQDLHEYEKVKKEFKALNPKRIKTPREENRDISAI